MQTQGSLSDGGLGALLETMQAERATGTLAVQNGGSSASLYFLFGHLFHASGPSGQGEDVVVSALQWRDGNYQFDPRAKLPAEETIKSSPSELIAAASSRQPAPATAPAQPSYFSAVVEPAHERSSAFDTYSPPAPSAQPQPVGDAGSGLASWAATQEAAHQPPAEPLAYAAPAPQQPAPAPVAAPVEHYAPVDASSTGQVVTAQFGGPENATVNYPLPSGNSHYEGLKSAFVDFPRLLRTLRSDRHTGYVRLTGVGSTYGGFILLHQGEATEAVSTNGVVSQGET
ncbi:MAG: DUF4388 domain-containing protein, partial [Candidatus Dormibacteraeota bacterium]|nr:DUF4388 domain-containing protein [Candidatus Dormibacteraeota bacterium]